MSNAGDAIASIAEQVGCTTFAVNRVRRCYRAAGISSFADQASGVTRAASAFLAAITKEAVVTNLLTLGHGFSIRRAARLAADLAKEAMIRISNDQMHSLLHQESNSVHRCKHTRNLRRGHFLHDKTEIH